jgi:predicted ATP-grasp superfamily ATP-dependent carboligase
MKLMELNPRTVSGLQMAVDSGCDMPWLAYGDATGASPAPITEFREGVRFVNISWEFQRVRRVPSRSPVKWLRFAVNLARARSFAMLSLRDPGPALSLIRRAMP